MFVTCNWLNACPTGTMGKEGAIPPASVGGKAPNLDPYKTPPNASPLIIFGE